MVKVEPAGLSSKWVRGLSTKRAWQDVVWLDTVLPVSSVHQITSIPTLSNCTVYGPTHSPDFESFLCRMLTLAPASLPKRHSPASMPQASRVAASEEREPCILNQRHSAAIGRVHKKNKRGWNEWHLLDLFRMPV